MIVDYDQQLRQIASRISVIAEAPGCSFIPSGRHVHESKDPTTGRGSTLSDAFSARLSRANSPKRRRELVEWAEGQIKARTHTPPQPDRKFKSVILEDWAGYHYTSVAVITSTPAMTIYRWRREAGFDGVHGKSAPMQQVSA